MNHSEKKLAHIANLQCGQAYFNNVLESVEKKDGGISNDTADKTPCQDAMNWFAL
ncbi:MAG: hypothetical protein ABSG78_20035 [Verrucomicrobiota bacterium]